jgi:chromosomal replication initiator protein
MQLVFEFPVNQRYTFDNFVVCEGNRTAFHFAKMVTGGVDGDNLLYIYGPPGSGKTHLLLAAGESLLRGECEARSRTGETVPYLSFKDIDEIYDGHYPAETVSKLGERFRESPILLVDDIHLIPDHASIKVELWQVFNDFYGAGKKIMITGLFPPKQLPGIDGHLISRLLWGLVAGIDVSDDDSRRMILKKLSEDRQVILPDDVAEYLLAHVRRDIPSLHDALETVNRHALSCKRKITVKLAREALGL